MFCPKCAAQNADGAKFCRVCGADISLVPQALTGQLAEKVDDKERDEGRRRRRRGTPTMEHAAQKFFMGLAFIFVSLAILFFMPGGRTWWFWMLIPSFGLIGSGVGMYLRVREERNKLAPPAFAPAAFQSPPPHAQELPPQRRNTGELVQPPSVTEATTRHLGIPAERKPKDV